jgi:cytochrome c oxidase subunit 2
MTLATDLSPLHPAGRGARVLGHELTFHFVLGGLVYLLVVALLVAIVIRQRRRMAAEEPMPEDARGQRWIWMGGIALPLAAISGVVAFSAVSLSSEAGGRGSPVERIEVIGHRWWWEVRYPGHHVITANHVVLPVGRPVRLWLETDDVIHSFWMPRLDRKMDMVPGQRTSLDVTVERPGRYVGECAEFCGLEHARMRFQIDALAPRDYAAWAAREARPVPGPATPAARTGERIFTVGTCAHCHTIAGTTASGRVGPDLTHLMGRRTIAAGTLRNTPGNLAGWVSDPQRLKPGAHMPRAHLSGPELQALLAYLRGLR